MTFSALIRARITPEQRAAFAMVCAAIIVLAGCVTEKRPIRPTISNPSPTNTANTNAQNSTSSAPIARPATDAATTSSRVTVALKPIGEIPFDGLVLPVLSPDASRLVTRVGGAPTWDALIASPDARAPFRSNIRAYDLTGAAPALIEPVTLPAGWLLGRSADASGFLAEVINPNGSRHIAKVAWNGGAPEWLVQGNSVNAHAALTPESGLIYCTRAVNEPRFSIAFENAGRVSTYTDPDASLLFPIPTPEQGLFYCYALTRASGLELRLVRAHGSSANDFAVESVWPLLSGDNATAFEAYQCAIRATVRRSSPYELLAIHPRMGSVAIFDPSTSSAAPLHRGSIAGAWLDTAEPPRAFLTAREGLMHQQATRTGAGLSPADAARVLREPWVAVSTTDPAFPWVLIGPEDSGAEPALVLVRMSLASPQDAAPISNQSSSE